MYILLQSVVDLCLPIVVSDADPCYFWNVTFKQELEDEKSGEHTEHEGLDNQATDLQLQPFWNQSTNHEGERRSGDNDHT